MKNETAVTVLTDVLTQQCAGIPARSPGPTALQHLLREVSLLSVGTELSVLATALRVLSLEKIETTTQDKIGEASLNCEQICSCHFHE